MIRSKTYIHIASFLLLIIVSNHLSSQINYKSSFQTDTDTLVIKDILYGTLLDQETKFPIRFANIIVETKGRQICSTTSNFDGFYQLNIPDSLTEFKVRISYVGYHTKDIIVQRNMTIKNENNSKHNSETKEN